MLYSKASLSLFRLMVIRRSWVGWVIIGLQWGGGCTREAGACGHNRGVSLSAQVALEVHGKAFLSPFRLMVIPQSWVGLMIMAMQGQHGCTREAPGGGHNRGVNLSAQALWGVHSKAALSLFRPMEIRRSWVAKVIVVMPGRHGYIMFPVRRSSLASLTLSMTREGRYG